MSRISNALISKFLTMLFFVSIVGCGGGSSNNTTPSDSKIKVSGKVTFDLIPINTETVELDFNEIKESSARGILVEALDKNNTIISSTSTNEDGEYSLEVNQNVDVKIRVSAKMIMTGNAKWDVQVSDNTSIIASKHPLYISETTLFSTSQDEYRNFYFPTGRNGLNNGKRSAAPFAILDAIYDAIQTVVMVDPDVEFPPLEIHWSSDNNTSQYDCWDYGGIGTTFYIIIDENIADYYYCESPPEIGQYRNKIYLLGNESTDADEFDRHVITHEWGHYFEQNLSRADSLGGAHDVSENLDPTVAFSEGLSNAFAAIATREPIYLDTKAYPYFQTDFNIESDDHGIEGWFSESSIQEILYDISDSDSDDGDTISMGFKPIYNVLTSDDFIQNEFQTTIHSFAQIFKDQQPTTFDSGLDALMYSQQIFGFGIDGEGETNDGGLTNALILPIYKIAFENSGPLRLCYNNENGIQNKLGNINYVLFEPQVAGYKTVSLVTNYDFDFDLSVKRSGREIAVNFNPTSGNTSLNTFISAQKHIIKVSVWDPYETIAKGNYCFDLWITTN